MCSCRTQDDELRLRDRYECTLDNHPPLEGRPTSLAETAAHFMEAQTFAISDIQISGTATSILESLKIPEILYLP